MAEQISIRITAHSKKDIKVLDSMKLEKSIFHYELSSDELKSSTATVAIAHQVKKWKFKLPIEETQLINFLDSVAMQLDFVYLQQSDLSFEKGFELPKAVDLNSFDLNWYSNKVLLPAKNGDVFIYNAIANKLVVLPYKQIVPDSLSKRAMTTVISRMVDDSTVWSMYSTHDTYIDSIINGEQARLYNSTSPWRSTATIDSVSVKSVQLTKQSDKEFNFHVWSSNANRRIVIPNLLEPLTAPPLNFNVVYQDEESNYAGVLADKVPVEYFPRRFQTTTNHHDTLFLGGPDCRWVRVFPKNRITSLKVLFDSSSGYQIGSLQSIGSQVLATFTISDSTMGCCLTNRYGVRQSPFVVFSNTGRIVGFTSSTNSKRFFLIENPANSKAIVRELKELPHGFFEVP